MFIAVYNHSYKHSYIFIMLYNNIHNTLYRFLNDYYHDTTRNIMTAGHLLTYFLQGSYHIIVYLLPGIILTASSSFWMGFYNVHTPG